MLNPLTINKAPHLYEMNTLEKTARAIRLNVLDMIVRENSSHLACCFSIIDILTVLYHRTLDVQSIAQGLYPRDIFILSKGHAAAALYGSLASVGIISQEQLLTFHQNGSILSGHPVRNKSLGIEASTGSLGHGFSLAVGWARALKDDGYPNKVFVLLGDGECQEGSVWEALEMAVRLGLSNLTAIIDVNGFQGLDKTSDIASGVLEQKCAAFGAETVVVSGHDYDELTHLFASPHHLPRVVLAQTIKGKGVDFLENKLEWHYKVPQGELYLQARAQLETL